MAIAKHRAIGRRGALPWHVPEDLKRFKALTTGHCVIMGRATHESIGRPLPNRRNLVVTKQALVPGCEVFSSLSSALASATQSDPLPFIIGGARLYAEALPLTTHLFITELDLDVPDADTFFPPIEAGQWREVRRTPGTSPGVTFIDLERSAA